MDAMSSGNSHCSSFPIYLAYHLGQLALEAFLAWVLR